jgi:hypothetical protein
MSVPEFGCEETLFNIGQNHPMFSHPLQKKGYEAVAAALPFAVDPGKITVEPGVSYLPSPIKLRDYAAGVMAAFGSVVEYLGALRGLPSQSITLNCQLCGFHLNEFHHVGLVLHPSGPKHQSSGDGFALPARRP